MSHSRFHTIVGALMGSTGIVYGMIEPRETRRHEIVMVNPGFFGLPHVARHEVISVIPGRIGAIQGARHVSIMVEPGDIGQNTLVRHAFVQDAFSTTDWSWVSNGGGNKMTAVITMLRPGEVYGDIEYSIDGAAWVSTGETLGSAIFNILNVMGSGLRLRAIIGGQPTPPSEEKLLSPLVLVQVDFTATLGFTTFDMPAFTFDPTKNYLVLVSAWRTTVAAMALTGNIGAIGRAPGAGTNLTAVGDSNSPNSAAPVAAYVITGQTGSLTFRTTSTQINTGFMVSMFEMLPGWTGVASFAGVGINTNSGAITITGFTPTLTPRPVINHMAPREQITVPAYTATTGKLIQGPPYSFSGISYGGNSMFPVTRVQRMTGAGNITIDLNVSARRSMLALELS